MNIDLSRLPPPCLVEELDYQVIIESMRSELERRLPGWTAAALESDPANKILEVAAYREMLMRQRVNEAARGVMVAFATGADLDHLAAFYPEMRLPGANATFAAELGLSMPLDRDVTVPRGYRLISKDGAIEAILTGDVEIPAGDPGATGRFEIIRPKGSLGNGILLAWNAVTPLPFVTTTNQLGPGSGGSDEESDNAFRRRIPQALERYSTAGPRGAYEYWAYTADERVIDVTALSPSPGDVSVVLLSSEGDGTADDAMISRVEAILSDETVRPLTDRVTVVSAKIVPYVVRADLVLYAGVSSREPYEEALRQIQAVTSLRCIGRDVPRSALLAAGHVAGVKEVLLLEPGEDLRVAEDQAAHCTAVEVSYHVASEP